MTSLTDRLRGIVRTPGAPAVAPVSAPADPANGSLAASSAEAALDGWWTADRRAFTVERRLRADARHGRVQIGDLAARVSAVEQHGSTLSFVTNPPQAPAPFVFFDLETTGLSGGAGTYAFLIGVAWFEDSDFLIRQHLLVDFSCERLMLERAGADFARAGSLVSFNGKSFDAPVLDTRYLFHRLSWPGAGRPHVDALHPARRFWRYADHGVRESCSLVALEEEILGVWRVGDVPGFEIPARYFGFVRTRDAAPLAAVFEHNRLDLISLAAITARLIELVDEGPGSARTAWEAFALGRAYADAGRIDCARAAFEHAIQMSPLVGLSPRVDALRALARVLRRARQYEESARAWRSLLDTAACPPHVRREAAEALAIHHEHRVRDFAAAKGFALQGLEGEGAGSDAAWRDAVRHRVQRIENKQKWKMNPASGRPLFASLRPLPPSSGSPTSAPRTSS